MNWESSRRTEISRALLVLEINCDCKVVLKFVLDESSLDNFLKK